MQRNEKERVDTFQANYARSVSFILMVLVLLPACLSREEYSPEQIQVLMDQEVEEKIDAYTKIKAARCKEDLLEEANRMADSIMIAAAFFDRDTAMRPMKPEKPQKPALITIVDSTNVKPLFDRRKLLDPGRDSSRK